MKCKRCPFVVACMSGALFKINSSYVCLCAKCSRLIIIENPPVAETVCVRVIPQPKRIVEFLCEKRSPPESNFVHEQVSEAVTSRNTIAYVTDPMTGTDIPLGKCSTCVSEELQQAAAQDHRKKIG